MEQNLLQKLTRPVYCYLNDLWKAITDIKNSIWDIKNDGIGTEKKPVNDIFTKRIKVGKNSIRIDERNINFESKGTKISGKRVGEEENPFDELHSLEVHASRVGTELSPVDKIRSKESEIDAMISLEIISDKIISPNFEGELTGNSSTASGIRYISTVQPSDPKEGDFWLDIADPQDKKLKIRLELEWKEIELKAS
jgi:hypothetical protein